MRRWALVLSFLPFSLVAILLNIATDIMAGVLIWYEKTFLPPVAEWYLKVFKVSIEDLKK